jgi:hypothetical protein
MKLNVYDKKEIVKTYEADSYDLMFGVVEDVANAVNLDAINTGSDAEIIKLVGNMVFHSLGTVKNLMKDIFEGITDEELKNVKIKEMAKVIVEVVKFTIAQMSIGDSKNAVTGR